MRLYAGAATRHRRYLVTKLTSTPGPDVVRVWLASLDRPALPLAWLASTLAPDESARAERFVFARDRERYQVARGLLRATVGGATGCAPDAVRFDYTPNGRPLLAGRGELVFNLSHSGGHVAIAIAAGGGSPALALGVDIEQVRPIPEMDQVARSVYAGRELAALASCADDEGRIATFHRLWTRKEACMKATGAGLALDPLAFSVDAAATVQRVVLPPHPCAPAGATVTVHHLPEPATEGCMGALAVGDERRRIEVLRIE